MEFLDYGLPSTITEAELPEEEVVIAPIGDVHWGANAFAKRSFMEYLEDVDKQYKNVYYIGMGDYADAYRYTVQKAFKNLSVDDCDYVDDAMRRTLEEFYDAIAHTKGKWLGLLQGNHGWTFRHGGTFETELCQMLGTEFLGDCADVQLKFMRPDGKLRGTTGLWVHHGTGGRKYPVGKLIDDICPHFPDSDVFLMGHTHLREYRDFIRMHRVGKKYVDRVGVAAITGGWLKGYVEGPSTYVERAALKPRAVGGLVVKIRPKQVHGIFSPRVRIETL